jgi:hypothetical protein
VGGGGAGREKHVGNEYFNLKKAKFTLKQAMKAQRGSRGIALIFL